MFIQMSALRAKFLTVSINIILQDWKKEYTDKLDEIVNKLNKTNRTIKIKPIDVKYIYWHYYWK